MPSKLINLSAFRIPTRLETSETVIGLSPEITLTSTSLSLNHCTVLIASSRILSAKTITAIGLKSFGNSLSLMGASAFANAKTLSPNKAYLFTTPAIFSYSSF